MKNKREFVDLTGDNYKELSGEITARIVVLRDKKEEFEARKEKEVVALNGFKDTKSKIKGKIRVAKKELRTTNFKKFRLVVELGKQKRLITSLNKAYANNKETIRTKKFKIEGTTEKTIELTSELFQELSSSLSTKIVELKENSNSIKNTLNAQKSELSNVKSERKSSIKNIRIQRRALMKTNNECFKLTRQLVRERYLSKSLTKKMMKDNPKINYNKYKA